MEEILHQLIGRLSHYLQGFIHPKWCRISSINSRESGGNVGMEAVFTRPFFLFFFNGLFHHYVVLLGDECIQRTSSFKIVVDHTIPGCSVKSK